MTYPWLSSYPDHIDWHASIPARPVPDILTETIQKFGQRPAFDFLGRKWTWQEIADQVDRLAKGLQDCGFKKGDRAALLLPNCPVFVISYYAILKAGGTVVNLNPLYTQDELHHMVQDSQVSLIITADLKILHDKAASLLNNSTLQKLIVASFSSLLPFPKNVLFSLARIKEVASPEYNERILRLPDLMDNNGRPNAVPVDPGEDVAVIQYTGGTTGTPKGAMLTHANVFANVEQARLWFTEARPGEDRMLGVIPFFHVFAMTAVMNFSVRCGFEIIATPRFDLEETLKIIDRKKPGIFPAVPAIYNAMNNSPKIKKYDLHSLKYCISGGAPLPAEVKKQFETLTGCVVAEGYGLTEASPVVCANPLNGKNKAGSIGLPLPGTVVAILDLETHQPVPQGERGELCVRGPQVMKGFWNNPEETAKSLAGGWLHTADIATMDSDGYVFIVDRLKDMIITNGYKVYPRNVEEAIYKNPAVEECIVAGLPDPARGEIVKAWIKPKEGQTITAEQMKAFLQDKISPMEMPRQMEFRDKPLPKTLIGKLSRKDVVAEEKK